MLIEFDIVFKINFRRSSSSTGFMNEKNGNNFNNRFSTAKSTKSVFTPLNNIKNQSLLFRSKSFADGHLVNSYDVI